MEICSITARQATLRQVRAPQPCHDPPVDPSRNNDRGALLEKSLKGAVKLQIEKSLAKHHKDLLSTISTLLIQNPLDRMESRERGSLEKVADPPSFAQVNSDVCPEPDATLVLHGDWESLAQKHYSRDEEEYISRPTLIADSAVRSFSKDLEDSTLHYCDRATKPTSRLRFMWELAGMFLISWDVIAMPMQVFDISRTFAIVFLEFLAPLYWTLDMLWSFFLGFYWPDGTEELRLNMTATKYLKSWFAYDVSVVAVDWFVLMSVMSDVDDFGVDQMDNILRSVRFLRFLRFSRLVKLFAFLKLIRQRIQSQRFLIMLETWKCVAEILLLCHMIACGWYAAGKYYDRSEYNWISHYKIEGRSFGYRYMSSLHWALVQVGVSTIEIIPVNTVERFYAVVTAIVALISLSFFVSSVTTGMFQNLDLHKAKHEQTDSLRRYLRKHNVSSPLRSMIWGYLKHSNMPSRAALPQAQICLIRTFPNRLYHALRVEVYTPVLSNHPLFRAFALHASKLTRGVVQGIFSEAVQETCLGVDQFLFEAGERAERMHFVTWGKLCYRTRKRLSQSDVNLESGAWLCEQPLWINWVHIGHSFSQSEVDLVSIDSTKFRRILTDEASMEAKRYAVLFLEYAIHNTSKLSDVFVDENALEQMSASAFLCGEQDGVVRPRRADATADAGKFSWTSSLADGEDAP